jgi:hypothetical protein
MLRRMSEVPRTIPGVSNSVFFRTKRARSGFYGEEPLLFGERTGSGWNVFFNRQGIVSAWCGRHDRACRFSFESTLDRSTTLTARLGLVVHLWCWRYHAAFFIGARSAIATLTRKKQCRATHES